MKKILLFTILLSFLAWVSFSWFCDATPTQTPPKPPICNNSPDWLENYLENVSYIVDKIDISKKEKWPSWLWSQTWKTPVWAVKISRFFISNGFSSFFQNFYIIFEDNHIVRDWTKLIDFKKKINKYFLQANWNSILNKNIDNQKEIQNKITQYSTFIVKWNFKTYKEVLKYIWINQLIIEQIYFKEIVKWWISNINDIKNNDTIKDIISNMKDNTQYTIDQNKLKKLIIQIKNTYYKDGKKIECSSTWGHFIKAIHNIVCNIWSDKTDKAIDRFECNYNRLEYTLGLSGNEWNCWSVQGKDWVSLKDKIKVNWLWETKSKTQELWKIISDKIPTKINAWLSSLFQSQGNEETNATDNMKHNISNLKLEQLKSKLNTTADTITEDKDAVNSMITKVEPGAFTHNTTKTFPQISNQIQQIRKKIWGSNNGKNTILNNTATACENQSPFGGKCRPSWN